MNWRATPLVSLATIVSVIGSTHSRLGLRVRSGIFGSMARSAELTKGSRWWIFLSLLI